MFVLRIQEFIKALLLQSSDLIQKDLDLLCIVKEKISLKSADEILLTDDVEWLCDIFVIRWNHVLDTVDDYTFNQSGVNSEWISLARDLSRETNKNYLQVLIPTVTNEFDPDCLARISRYTDPRDLYLSEDNITCRSVQGLFDKLKASPGNLSTYDVPAQIQCRSLTLTELSRLRNKQVNIEYDVDKVAKFWDYLILEVAPHWQQCGEFNKPMFLSLLEGIETFLQSDEVNTLQKFNLAFVSFKDYLSKSSLADVTYLFGMPIQHEGTSVYLLELLLDCLQGDTDYPKKLNAIQFAICKIDSSLQSQAKSYVKVEALPDLVKYFDIRNLHDFLANSLLDLQPVFSASLIEFDNRFIERKEILLTDVDDLISLFNQDWSAIVNPSDDYSCSVGKQYENIWQFYIQQYAPQWRNLGHLPYTLIPGLLELIDTYYTHIAEENLLDIKQGVVNFINSFSEYSLEDVNFLFGQQLIYRGQNIFLLELLISCLQSTDSITEKFKSIASLITTIDPSLISKSMQLDSVYKTMHVGRYFDIDDLKVLLNKLEFNGSSILNRKMQDLNLILENSTQVDKVLLEKIADIYAQRWIEIIDTENDYTRTTNGLNQSWIRLAQCLAGANLINSNYYKLLIPTIMHKEEFVTKEPLTAQSITSYILSDNERELIYLPNCKKHYEVNGTFYNCNHPSAKPLTKKEKQRLSHSAQSYAQYFTLLEDQTYDLAVSKDTVSRVRDLAEGSLFPIGLILGEDYDDLQMKSAESAYKEFLRYIASISEDEKARLYNQHILLNQTRISFLQLLNSVLKIDGECIAVSGRYLIKFVVDYDPFLKFSKELESKVEIEEMRQCCAKKVYREYDFISDAEAKKRILIIFASLMTHSFQYVLNGTAVNFEDSTNVVTSTGSKIFQLIEKVIIAPHCDDTRYIYASLMEGIVKPALSEDGFKTSVTRFRDTRVWLQTIKDGSIFHSSNMQFFEPGSILTVLWTYANVSKLKSLMEPCLEELVHIMAENQAQSIQWVRINITFNKFLQTLESNISDNILAKLRSALVPVSHSQVIETTKDFVIHRLASFVAQDKDSYYNFFKGTKNINSYIYMAFCKKYRQALSCRELNDDISMNDLLSNLQDIARIIIGQHESRQLLPYFEKLKYQAPGIIRESSYSNIGITIPVRM